MKMLSKPVIGPQKKKLETKVHSIDKMKTLNDLEEKISLNYQGCYKNKVCYPAKAKNIIIKYDKKSISSVKIYQISAKI